MLVGAGADLVCIETMTDLEEALLAVRAVRSISTGMPVIATMTFDLTPRGPFTVMGVSVPRAAEALAAAGADVVGSNCGAGVEEMLVVAEAFLACANVPVAIQPNAGLPLLKDGKLTYPDSPDRFAEAVAPLAARGVRILGGCCGTTPAHIHALRRVGRSLGRANRVWQPPSLEPAEPRGRVSGWSGVARRRVSSVLIVPVRDPSPRFTAPANHHPRGSAGSG